MNKNFKSGGLKLRELDSSQSPKTGNKNILRSKEDVLKLFDKTSNDDSLKENNVVAAKINENTNDEEKIELQQQQQTKPIVEQKSGIIQSNDVDSSDKAPSFSSETK